MVINMNAKKRPIRRWGAICAQTVRDARGFYSARSTLPERKQRVQAYTRFGVPLTSAFTRLIFGFQVLLERLCEWETLMPKDTSFPQISHLAIYLHLLKVPNSSLQR